MTPAIFQSIMDRILHNLPVTCYLDDILIAAPIVGKGTTVPRRQWDTFARREMSNWSRASGVSGPHS